MKSLFLDYAIVNWEDLFNAIAYGYQLDIGCVPTQIFLASFF